MSIGVNDPLGILQHLSSSQGFQLTYDRGKQIQEILHRYSNSIRESLAFNETFDIEDIEEMQKDIFYIEELAELFD